MLDKVLERVSRGLEHLDLLGAEDVVQLLHVRRVGEQLLGKQLLEVVGGAVLRQRLEALHDFRVAIRRLRSTLRAWRPELKKTIRKVHLRRLRDLQTATGSGRDAEVALEWLAGQRPELHPAHRRGHDWLADRLQRRHVESMDHVRADVRAAFTDIDDLLVERLSVIKKRLQRRPGGSEPTFGEALAVQAREDVRVLAERLRRVESGEDRELCHAARIAGKRLRYLLEPARPYSRRATSVVKSCKRLQDVLGELNDAHILRAELGEAVEAAAAERARELHRLALDPDGERVRRAARRSERPGLLELTRRVQRRIDGLFERLQKEWLLRGLDDLVDQVEALGGELERAAHPDVELERKYLLRALPVLPSDVRVASISHRCPPSRTK